MDKINTFIKKYPNYHIQALNISYGILVKRIVYGNKVKFKVADEKNLIPKDHLDIFNICKKKYSILSKPTFEPNEEMFFLFISPYHAHIIQDYKEDLRLISLNKTFLPSSEYLTRYSLKSAEFSKNLNDLNEEFNYLIFITEGSKIIDSGIFYCDKYKEYIDAAKEATFGNFLNIVRAEEIKNEQNLISYLAKYGIPKLVQDKYLDFWKDYDEFLDIVDDIHLVLKRKEIEVEDLVSFKVKDPRSALIKLLQYDIRRAYDFLEELNDS